MITLHQQPTEYGEITILRSRDTGSCIYCQDGSYQSEADSRGVSLASYVHAIHGLIAQREAKAVLLIGCGGGTLATMLSYGGMCATVVDVNPASFVLARTYFSLPEHVSFHPLDGAAFLDETQARFDAIVVDAFVGDKIPGHLRSRGFFETVRGRLTSNGMVLFNVHLRHDFDPDADSVGAAMLGAGLPVRILDAPGVLNRNAIVLGGAVAPLKAPDLAIAPEFSATQISEELARMRFRPCRRLRPEPE